MEITKEQLKLLAKNLQNEFKPLGLNIKYSLLLESFSHTLGFKDFNSLSEKMIDIHNSNKKEPLNLENFLSMLKLNDFDYKKSNPNFNIEEDKNILIKSLNMTLYDLCNLYFKRTFMPRKYYHNANVYFNKTNFTGNRVLSISKIGDIAFFVLPNDTNLRNDYQFEVILYTQNINVLLFYSNPKHFALDLFDFLKLSDYRLSIKEDSLIDMFINIFASENITNNLFNFNIK